MCERRGEDTQTAGIEARMRVNRFCTMLAAVCGLLALAQTRAALADEADPARKAYDRHVGCAGIAAAAVAETQMLGSGSEKEKMDARTVLTVTRGKALADGKSLGLTPEAVAKAIEKTEGGILKKVTQAQGAAAEKEKADLGRVLIECALVDKFER